MPNIVIKEIDETSPGTNISEYDVVYVPGFANTNSSVYIYTIPAQAPDIMTRGVVATSSDTYNSNTSHPCFACNISDKKTWKCVAISGGEYIWEEQALYIEPYPENVPVTCTTVDEFETNFGRLPYCWQLGYKENGEIETADELKSRVQFPNFEEAAFSGNAKNYAYNPGDYEKSYMYAKELINLGIPVLYENVVDRNSSGRKILPNVQSFYTMLSNCFEELKDKGEYTVKYITSGAYPTFEYDGAQTFYGEFTDSGNINVMPAATGIDTLVGTSWQFRVTGDFTDLNDEYAVELSFTSNNTSYTSFRCRGGTLDFDETNTFQGNSWANEAYRFIAITGGDDATSPEVISWFCSNAIQIGEQFSNPTPNCSGAFHDTPIGGPQEASLTINYKSRSWSEHMGGTKWAFEDNPFNAQSGTTTLTFEFNLLGVLPETYESIELDPAGNEIDFLDAGGVPTVVYSNGVWTEDKYKRIIILQSSIDVSALKAAANISMIGGNGQEITESSPEAAGLTPYRESACYNTTLCKAWRVTSESGTRSTQISLSAGEVWVDDGTNPWVGGVGNTIQLTSDGILVTYQSNWDWSSAVFTASAESTVIVPGGGNLMGHAMSIAAERGDAVALIDHTNNPARDLSVHTGANPVSVYDAVKALNYENGEVGAMFTPWASYNLVKEGATVPSTQIMPASFGYLASLGKSLKTNPNWVAVAGVSRGLVPYVQTLNTIQKLTNTIADAYQPRDAVAINPITNIKPYGLTIWGNRTLKKNVGNITATSMLNIRNLVSDVKKVAYTTAKSLMFEQNSDVLWVNFKAGITPLLDQMLSGQGLSGYKIIKGVSKEKAKVVAQIKLYPLYAVEDFDITVVISDEEVSVS